MSIGSNHFSGRVAVVTGGTQGLGEATARLFAQRGAAGLVICGRNEDRGRRVAADITSAGCPTIFVRADLARVEDCFAVVDAAEHEYGRLDSLVNCAALTDRGAVDDTTQELWDRMFAVNVRAPFFLLQRAVQVMRARRIEGTIVNVITVSSHGGAPYLVAYAASKGALATLTKNTANALVHDRIRVNGLNIGWMNTQGEDAIQKRFHDAPDDWLERAARQQPFGRLLEPEEVARAIAFLASDESGMMTGSVIDFDQIVVGTVPDEARF
jgi:NAD(P)-dependent dehydrogenase (short-subunit alcohol dehydrogenase family)